MAEVKGIEQLDKGIDILAAVGAGQCGVGLEQAGWGMGGAASEGGSITLQSNVLDAERVVTRVVCGLAHEVGAVLMFVFYHELLHV